MFLEKITWKQAEGYFKEKDIAIIPVGSTENHGSQKKSPGSRRKAILRKRTLPSSPWEARRTTAPSSAWARIS